MGSLHAPQTPLTTALESSTTAPLNEENTDPEYLTSPPISDYVQSLLNANQQAQTHGLDSTPSLPPISEVVQSTDSLKRKSFLKNPLKFQILPPLPRQA